MSSTISVLRSKRPEPRWLQMLSHTFRAYDQPITAADEPDTTPRFRFVANAIEVWGLMALAFAGIAALFPRFFHAQLSGGPMVFLATFAAFGLLVTAPAEWFFHRFGLHRLLAFRLFSWLRIVPETSRNPIGRAWQRMSNNITIGIVYYLARMAFGHSAHHKITDITPINPGRLTELFTAISRYEITTNRQTEDAVFPHFSVVGFWLVALPIVAILQPIANALASIPALHLPHLPILLAAMVSMTYQVWLYEASHAIMHRPFAEWWLPRIKSRPFGWFYSYVYRFHFFHHMNESCSLGVVGGVWFCYIWDRIFGTYKLARLEVIESASRVQPDVLEMSSDDLKMLPGVEPDDFAAPRPSQPWIARLDSEAAKSQDTWNKLFVAALTEVRRRDGAPTRQASVAGVRRVPAPARKAA